MSVSDNLSNIEKMLGNGLPDFSFNPDDSDVEAYYTIYMLLLEDFYENYKHKTAEEVMLHIHEDVQKLQKNMLNKTDILNDKYVSFLKEYLRDKGVVEDKLDKVKLDKSRINYLIKEQKQTIRNICTELEGQIKSKYYYYTDKEFINIFSVNGNVGTAVGRLKKLSENGIRGVKGHADRHSMEVVYGNPLVRWVTCGDARVCAYCAALEDTSPMLLEDCPQLPLHLNCRCNIELVEGSESDNDLFYYNLTEE